MQRFLDQGTGARVDDLPLKGLMAAKLRAAAKTAHETDHRCFSRAVPRVSLADHHNGGHRILTLFGLAASLPDLFFFGGGFCAGRRRVLQGAFPAVGVGFKLLRGLTASPRRRPSLNGVTSPKDNSIVGFPVGTSRLPGASGRSDADTATRNRTGFPLGSIGSFAGRTGGIATPAGSGEDEAATGRTIKGRLVSTRGAILGGFDTEDGNLSSFGRMLESKRDHPFEHPPAKERLPVDEVSFFFFFFSFVVF